MGDNELSGSQEYWDSLSKSEREALQEGLHAMAELIIGIDLDGSSVPVEESAGPGTVMDADEFWDTYGTNLVAFANYCKHGLWNPEDGLDVYRPGLVEGPDGLEPGFVLVKRGKWNPDLP